MSVRMYECIACGNVQKHDTAAFLVLAPLCRKCRGVLKRIEPGDGNLACTAGGSLLKWGNFRLSSRIETTLKIDCDALTNQDLETAAKVISSRLTYNAVVSVPTGGDRLAFQLRKYSSRGLNQPTLIVDDVLTTGASMERARAAVNGPCVGAVLFARGPVPDWVWAMFEMMDPSVVDSRLYKPAREVLIAMPPPQAPQPSNEPGAALAGGA